MDMAGTPAAEHGCPALSPKSGLGDCLSDSGRNVEGPTVQRRVTHAVAGSNQVDERGSVVFTHREGEFFDPLRHAAPDPAAIVVAGLRKRGPLEAAGDVVDGLDISGVSSH